MCIYVVNPSPLEKLFWILAACKAQVCGALCRWSSCAEQSFTRCIDSLLALENVCGFDPRQTEDRHFPKRFQRWKPASYYINYPGPKEVKVLQIQRNFRVHYWQVRPSLLERYMHTDTYRYIPSKSAVWSLIERTKGDIPDRYRHPRKQKPIR